MEECDAVFQREVGMAYSDNPRKIYGKVEVIYADEELSRDITTEESGN